MKRWVVMMVVLGLMFVGCSRPADESAPGHTEKEALEATKEAIPEEAAKAVDEDPDVKSCLQLVKEDKFDSALPVCLKAHKKYPANDRVKDAVEKAKAAVADAAAAVTDSAEDAQKAAEEKAQGAIDDVTGNLAP